MRYDGSLLCHHRWSPFWSRYLADYEALHAYHSAQTAYVAIDFEGRHGFQSGQLSGTSEVAVAVLRPHARNSDGHVPPTTAAIVDQYQLQSCAFPIEGRQPSASAAKNRETACFFTATPVAEEDVEETLVALLTALRAELPPSTPMVLVGYAMEMEFSILNASLPGVVAGGFFAAWVDLQETVQSVCGSRPSLCDALLALGFPYGEMAAPGRVMQHRAGNDVVRELALLLHMLHYGEVCAAAASMTATASLTPSTTLTAPIPQPFSHPMRPPKKNKSKVDQASVHRPRPFAAHPFTVSVSLADKSSLRQIARHVFLLRRLFADYDLVTVAMSVDGARGWVSLPTAETCERFVAETEGQMRNGKVWRARLLPVSGPVARAPDPNSRRGRKKLGDMRQPGNAGVQDERQQERAERKQAMEMADLSMGVMDMDIE